MAKKMRKKLDQLAVPTTDFLEHRNLDDQGALEWLVEDFNYAVESGYFLQWEAVIRQEQRLPLTRKQKDKLNGLINFGDPDERILYIDEMPRPVEPWYQTVRKIAPKLLLEKLDTTTAQFSVAFEGWPKLGNCLDEHAQDLSR